MDNNTGIKIDSSLKLLKDSFESYKLNWKVLVFTSFLATGINKLGQKFLFEKLRTMINVQNTNFLEISSFLFLTFFFTFLISIPFLFQVALLSEIVKDKEEKLVEKITRVYKKGPFLLITAFLNFSLIILGLLFFIVPGLILFFLFSNFIWVVMNENLWGWKALKQSMNYVIKNFKEVLLKNIFLVMLFGLAALVALTILIFFQIIFVNLTLTPVVMPLISALMPLMSIFLFNLYKQLQKI